MVGLAGRGERQDRTMSQRNDYAADRRVRAAQLAWDEHMFRGLAEYGAASCCTLRPLSAGRTRIAERYNLCPEGARLVSELTMAHAMCDALRAWLRVRD